MAKLVMIVDDNRALAEGLAEILESEGCQIRVFDDPNVALRESRSLPFDIALLDIAMPGMDGVALQRQLMQQNPRARFVLMTGYADDKRIAQGLAAGACAVLPKPVPLAKLFEAMGDLDRREVLLVEDDGPFREALAEALGEDGYPCHAVASAHEARTFLAQQRTEGKRPAVGVIDVRLPDEDGVQLARELMNSDGIPCILITGWEQERVAGRSQSTPLLLKPFSPDALLRMLSELRSSRP